MAICRFLLALLIALAVSVAPVSVAVAGAHPAAKAAMHDCHGKAPADCPHCDKSKLVDKNKCPGDDGKCCKLIGTLATAARVTSVLVAADESPDLQRLIGRHLRPQPPPPRS